MADSIAKNVNDVITNISDFNEFVDSKSFKFTTNPQNLIVGLKLKGNNAKIIVQGHDEDFAEVSGIYKPRLGRTLDFKLLEENGHISLDYDENSVKYVRIYAKVPNYSIKDIDLFTNNGKIELEDIKAQNAYIKTSNSSLKASRATIESIIFNTSNGAITLEEVLTKKANLFTSNGAIKIFQLDSIEGEATLDIKTSNGSVTIDSENTSIKFSANTSNGKIITSSDFIYNENRKNFVKAMSQNYEESKNKLNIKIITSNAAIQIK